MTEAADSLLGSSVSRVRTYTGGLKWGTKQLEHNSKNIPQKPPKTPQNNHAKTCKGRQNRAGLAAPSAAESPSRAETQAGSAAPSAVESPRQRRKSLFGGTFGSRKACLPSHVRRPKVLRLPNLVSARGQKLGSLCTKTSPSHSNMHITHSNHANIHTLAPRGFKLS